MLTKEEFALDVGDSGMGDFIRTFPVLLRDQEGHKWRVLFDSWAVHKGMVSIPYRLDAQSDTYSESVNITIGHEYFTSGMQNLILEYRTRNEIHVSQGKATLERNMTGIWPGPLDSVVAQVELPAGVRPTVATWFTDATASSLTCDCRTETQGTTITAITNHPLPPGKDLHLILRFSADSLELGAVQRIRTGLADHAYLSESGLFLLMITLYFFGSAQESVRKSGFMGLG